MEAVTSVGMNKRKRAVYYGICRGTRKLKVTCSIHLWKIACPTVLVEDEVIVFFCLFLSLSEFHFLVDELDFRVL
jgi:hypothetical protein